MKKINHLFGNRKTGSLCGRKDPDDRSLVRENIPNIDVFGFGILPVRRVTRTADVSQSPDNDGSSVITIHGDNGRGRQCDQRSGFCAWKDRERFSARPAIPRDDRDPSGSGSGLAEKLASGENPAVG